MPEKRFSPKIKHDSYHSPYEWQHMSGSYQGLHARSRASQSESRERKSAASPSVSVLKRPGQATRDTCGRRESGVPVFVPK